MGNAASWVVLPQPQRIHSETLLNPHFKAASQRKTADYNEVALHLFMVKPSPAPAIPAPAAAASAPLPTIPPETLPDTYEAALSELERLVGAMEAGQLPLDRLLDTYRRGATLLDFCRGRLEAVEQQVKVLEDGQLKPWNPT